MKLLGIFWNPISDVFKPIIQPIEPKRLTKREVLSVIARIYDPLGWLSPVVIQAKIFMQELWRQKLDRDAQLPDSMALQWTQFRSSLPLLAQLEIPHWTGAGADSRDIQLHAFSDASNKACAAALYLREPDSSGKFRATLLLSKIRVAPAKTISIPKLELRAAALLAELLAPICQMPEYSPFPAFCWTDSTNVLAYLSRDSSAWKSVYVANRVSLIHSLLPDCQWNHVRGLGNPADLASRGVAAADLLDNDLWWRGPSWLSGAQDSWPIRQVDLPNELLTQAQVFIATTNVAEDPLAFVTHISSWSVLLRVISRVLRWTAPISSLKARLATEVSGAEVIHSTLVLFRVIQSQQFTSELNDLRAHKPVRKTSSIANLCPVLDDLGLIRVGGRLTYASLDEPAKHPIILKRHPAVRLLVMYAHGKCLHGGLSLTLSMLRTYVWIVQATKIVRSVIQRCLPCARLKAVVFQQQMAPLPASRISRPSRPFEHCGVDYAGLFSVRKARGRGNKSFPAYIAIFICFAINAVHLEVVSDYSTAGFLAAFHRFCARRGTPRHMYSDCGTNFKRADRELRQAFQDAIRDDNLQAIAATEAISWHFNPPPPLKRPPTILVARTPTYEELTTLTAQVQACLNSRPLAPLNESIESLDTLTPAHFLIGGPIVELLQPSLLNAAKSRLSRWQDLRQVMERFWSTWARDYVQSLQKRFKWREVRDAVKGGQIVLLKNDQLPPIRWSLARVVCVHHSPDGLIRKATIRTATSTFGRPISKLALLPIYSEANRDGVIDTSSQ